MPFTPQKFTFTFGKDPRSVQENTMHVVTLNELNTYQPAATGSGKLGDILVVVQGTLETTLTYVAVYAMYEDGWRQWRDDQYPTRLPCPLPGFEDRVLAMNCPSKKTEHREFKWLPLKSCNHLGPCMSENALLTSFY